MIHFPDSFLKFTQSAVALKSLKRKFNQLCDYKQESNSAKCKIEVENIEPISLAWLCMFYGHYFIPSMGGISHLPCLVLIRTFQFSPNQENELWKWPKDRYQMSGPTDQHVVKPKEVVSFHIRLNHCWVFCRVKTLVLGDSLDQLQEVETALNNRRRKRSRSVGRKNVACKSLRLRKTERVK